MPRSPALAPVAAASAVVAEDRRPSYEGAPAPQPAHTPELDTDRITRCGYHPPAHATRSPPCGFDARTLGRKPIAVIPHAGICAGAARKGGPKT